MKKVFVFCIGGTGIRVMKSVTMLMASGMSTNGYTVVPVILDPHLDLEEKKNLHSLIESYEEIYRHSVNNGTSTLNALDGFFNSQMLTIGELNEQLNDTQQAAGNKEKFRSYINVANLGANDINNFIFGGTGASGYPLLEKKIRGAADNPTVKNALMGAVTVLPYYGLKDPTTTGSDIDSANFYTKTKAALAYYQNTVQSDYLYYAGEKTLRQVYENDEKKQEDTANFIELVAASALFDFLKRERPDKRQYLTRAIDDDVESLDLVSMGSGYKDIVKCIADYMILRTFIQNLPNENFFPLKKNRGLDGSFYKDAAFQSLVRFTDKYYQWYSELSTNKRAFAPLHYDNIKQMDGWVKSIDLEAKDDSYYLLRMIEASNGYKAKDHSNKFRFFLQFAYDAINNYTKKIMK